VILSWGSIDELDPVRASFVMQAVALASTSRSSLPCSYLPPYSPDLNPIEQAFAKLKAALRQAAERTREVLWRLIGQSLDRYLPQECRNFFNSAGYAT
jgi:transposase